MKATKKSTTIHSVSQASGNYRHEINPTAYTHFVATEGTYVPKFRPNVIAPWQKVSDQTCRGFKSESAQLADCVANFAAREQVPRPDMRTITTQKFHDLDLENRYFKDNLQRTEIYGNKQLLEKFKTKKPIASATSGQQLVAKNSKNYAPKMYCRSTKKIQAPGKENAKVNPSCTDQSQQQVDEQAEKAEEINLEQSKTDLKTDEVSPVDQQEQGSPRPDLDSPKYKAKKQFFANADPCQQKTTFMFEHPLQATGSEGKWATESNQNYFNQQKSLLKSSYKVAGVTSRPGTDSTNRPGKEFTQRKVDYQKREPQIP